MTPAASRTAHTSEKVAGKVVADCHGSAGVAVATAPSASAPASQSRSASSYTGSSRRVAQSNARATGAPKGSALCASPRASAASSEIDPAPRTAYQPNAAIHKRCESSAT